MYVCIMEHLGIWIEEVEFCRCYSILRKFVYSNNLNILFKLFNG